MLTSFREIFGKAHPKIQRMLVFLAKNPWSTAEEVSAAGGYPASPGTANSHLGRFAHRLVAARLATPTLKYDSSMPALKGTPIWISALVNFDRNADGLVTWSIKTRFRAAVPTSGTSEFGVSDTDVEEFESKEPLTAEGRRRTRVIASAERSRTNRNLVLRGKKKPYRCDACGFVFADRYGPEYAGLIEVHHKRPVALGPRRPRRIDFLVLCSNCHSVAHWKNARRPLTLKALDRLLISSRSVRESAEKARR